MTATAAADAAATLCHIDAWLHASSTNIRQQDEMPYTVIVNTLECDEFLFLRHDRWHDTYIWSVG